MTSTQKAVDIERLKSLVKTAALAGALVPLGLAATADTAQAGEFFDPKASHVEGTVTDEGSLKRYNFEVFNDTFCSFNSGSRNCSGGFGELVIVDWELPLFSLDGISDIQSPMGWDYEIISVTGEVLSAEGAWDGAGTGQQSLYYNNAGGEYGNYSWTWTKEQDPVWQDDNSVYGSNPDQYETPSYILHWFACSNQFNQPAGPVSVTTEGDSGFGCDDLFGDFSFASIQEGDSLDGFTFLAEAGPTNAPYMASWYSEPPTIGDPPTPLAVGVPNNRAPIPAPATLALFGVGLIGLAALRRRQNKA
ncbi:MAG: PEP-CTERM sorting domain-containing protein [Rhodobacterales bacterium]|nr:PEP-CTERM sorting domain-containing protein [Rhodobacterales bacterium]